MQIKAADDKQPQIDALTALLARPDVDAATRGQIDSEIRRMRAGAAGEREAAYEIEFDLGANPNHMTIHDLRLEVDGRVAQIDHLILTRLLDVWVLESKHFSEGVAVDEFGEWTGFFNRRPYGIGSPIEQNRKHVAVLQDAFAKGLVELPRRLGFTLKPVVRSLVLVSKDARITRPKTKAARARVEGLDSVIKVDQLVAYLDKDWNAKGIANLRRLLSRSEVERLARDLVALHRPASVDWAARFGLATTASPIPTPVRHTSTGAMIQSAPTGCESCGRNVSDAVMQYCRDQAQRFAGRVLCFTCQRRARRA